MRRVTISIDNELIRALDRYMEAVGHQNRSEVVRDLVRASLQERTKVGKGSRHCVAALVYYYEPETRQLASRLMEDYRLNSGLSLSRTNLEIDAETCLEVSLLRGKRSRIEKFSQQIIGEHGVRYGQLVVIPT